MNSHQREVRKFFELLFPVKRGWIELRPFLAGEPVREERAWISVKDKSNLVQRALEMGSWLDTYFGVAVRSRESKQRHNAQKKYLSFLTTLFADLDAKDFSKGMDGARGKVENFHLKPSVIVNSGHGFHLYFLLNEPVELGESRVRGVEALLKALGQELNGDSISLAQILRVPATCNWKDPFAPRPVRMVKLEDRRYDIDSLKEALDWREESEKLAESAKTSSPHLPESTESIELDSLEISQRMKQLIRQGREGKFKESYPSRSECDQAVITSLLSSGYGEKVIKSVFESFPIGEKYREKGKHGDKYLAHSIKRARLYLAKP
ncbi:hypothetical protein K9M06_00985 [Candidatus Bipolaricaulota bacterium]|nr:hypothetical protein [Candidatus Bipolaricaulota bacterium]